MKGVKWAASLALAVGLTGVLPMVSAKVSQEEAARLGIEGTELTPMGAIRAGNADGSIPAWEGGIKTPPAGYTQGGWYIDPYADDKVTVHHHGAEPRAIQGQAVGRSDRYD